MIRTYIDTNVLINAFRGEKGVYEKAMAVLEDENRTIVVSGILKLEVLVKPTINRKNDAVDFYNTIFESAEYVPVAESVIECAFGISCRYGLTLVDAIHLSLAKFHGVDEFVTFEKETKPMFNVEGVKVTSLL